MLRDFTIKGDLIKTGDNIITENVNVVSNSPGGNVTIYGNNCYLNNVYVEGDLNIITGANGTTLKDTVIDGDYNDDGDNTVIIAAVKVATVHGIDEFEIQEDGFQLEYKPQPNAHDSSWFWFENNGEDANMLATAAAATGPDNTEPGGDNQSQVDPYFGKDSNPVRAGCRTFALTDVAAGARLDEVKLEFTYNHDLGHHGIVTINFWITDGEGHYGIFAPTSGGMGNVAEYTDNGDGTTTVLLDLTDPDIPDGTSVAVYEHNGLVDQYGDPYTDMTWGGDDGIKHLTLAGPYDYQRSPTNGWEAWGTMFNPIIEAGTEEVTNEYGIALIWGDTVGGTKRWNEHSAEIKNVYVTVDDKVYLGEFESAQSYPLFD